jgi:hypothetical protein
VTVARWAGFETTQNRVETINGGQPRSIETDGG